MQLQESSALSADSARCGGGGMKDSEIRREVCQEN